MDVLPGPRSPRIIEFLGLPGSGKSTLADALLGRSATGWSRTVVPPSGVLGTSRVPLPSALDGLLRSGVERLPRRGRTVLQRGLWRTDDVDALAVLSITHPDFLALIAHAPPPPDADAAEILRWRSWPLGTLTTHVRLRRVDAPGRTVIIEEGLVQRANTVCIGDVDLVARYFGSQPLPDALVVLHVDPTVAQERLQTRAKRTLHRHVGRDAQAVLRDLERSARLVRTATEVLGDRGLKIIELPANTSTAERCERVRALLEPSRASESEGL